MLLRNISPGNIAARVECRLPGAVLLRQVDGNGDDGSPGAPTAAPLTAETFLSPTRGQQA